jgi:SAM-dependent methyltransferase
VSLHDHVPALLRRARALLRLAGGPEDALAVAEVRAAAKAVFELHEGLIGERALARPSTYEGARLGAYLLWWWPQSYVKTAAALRMAPMPRAPRILDAGSGPAPAAAAALDALGGEAVCFDQSDAALAEARALGIARTTREMPRESFDLTLVTNVLSELEDPAQFLRALSGLVVVIEPALRETGRALLQVRDRLLGEGWFAAAPCLMQAPCPALASAKDWCTAEARWTPPRYFVQLADATGLRADEMLSFAPLILSRSAPSPAPSTWRVVGVPPPEKGKKRVWICGSSAREPLVRLDRDASDENEDIARLARGDLVELSGLERRGDGLRAGKGATVRKLG